MKVGVIGAGNVGSALGLGLAKAGHAVVFGVRDPGAAKHAALVQPNARLDTVRAAVEASEVVILATPWGAAEAALAEAGDFGGRTLIDATNPIGPGFVLTHGQTDSGAEQVARWAKNAKVVKAFNTTGAENMANPVYGSARSAMFVAGDDAGACTAALTLAKDLGFDAVRVGGLVRARVLEPAAMLWISLAQTQGTRGIALGLLRR